MQQTLLFLVGTFFFSITAMASAPTCASIFAELAPQQVPENGFRLNFAELGDQQNFVARTMQSAREAKSNREYNTAMLEAIPVLNRMFDQYLITIKFAQDHMNEGNKEPLLAFLQHNQNFFASFIGRKPEELMPFLQARANALMKMGEGNPHAMASIGFIQNPTQGAGTPPMASIGFIQNPHQGKDARPLASIGFIQPPAESKDQAPAKKLPTIGFVQPKETAQGESSYQPPKADVGYRLAIMFDMEFGVFEVQREKAR